MNPQRRISAKLISPRAPIHRAPSTANRIKAYMASAESRVNIHMAISKLRPRFFRGRTLFVLVAMSASQRRIQDQKSRDPKYRDKDRPFDPDGFCLVLQEPGEQVDDGNAQAVNGMEQRAEENEDLEGPVRINAVQKAANIPTQEGRQQMHRHENRHPQPADPVQDKRQLVTLSPVTQACPQWDIPFQAHLSLLDTVFMESK